MLHSCYLQWNALQTWLFLFFSWTGSRSLWWLCPPWASPSCCGTPARPSTRRWARARETKPILKSPLTVCSCLFQKLAAFFWASGFFRLFRMIGSNGSISNHASALCWNFLIKNFLIFFRLVFNSVTSELRYKLTARKAFDSALCLKNPTDWISFLIQLLVIVSNMASHATKVFCWTYW